MSAILDPASWKHLVEDSSEPMFVTRGDLEHVICYVNPAAVNLLGYVDASALVGKPAMEALIHAEDRALFVRFMTHRVPGAPRIELRWLRSDGEPIYAHNALTEIEFDGLPAVLVTARDHSRRHDRGAALVTLRQSEERSRVMFELAPVPMCVFERKTTKYIAVNQAMLDMYGYTRDEMLSMSVRDINPPARMLEILDRMVSGTTKRIGVTRHRRKDGRLLEVDITSHALEFEGRVAVLAICLDVTESRKLEDQLRQSQKMDAIGQLAGGVAHDFNNILGVIMANAELALESTKNKGSVVEEVAEIMESAERAAALTRQLLAFSRQSPRETRIIALNTVVTNLEKMLCRIVGEDIVMSAVLMSQLGSIDADVNQLEQILVNLVVNARDAMPTGGKLVIETENVELDHVSAAELGVVAGSYVALAVSDTGCGMDEATRSRIFEPFFTTKPVGKGTGLGLSTVFGIVKQSGGGIATFSEPRCGTTFRVYFPRVSAALDTIAPPTPQAIQRGTETILVVEDDLMLRNMIHRHLQMLGYRPIATPHAAAALDMLYATKEHIDLLLTDLVMPGLDGRALATEALRVRPKMRVVFMSGYTEHVAVTTAKLTPYEHFVEKPFTVAKLSSAIRRALND